MLDAVGNTIPEGSYLAWAVRVGSCYAAMRVGKVLCATSTPDKNSYGGGSNNRISVLVVTKHWASEAQYVRKTTLSIPERAILLHPDMVPNNVKALLGSRTKTLE